MTESFELQAMVDSPRKTVPPTAAIGSDDTDGTITAWSLATFTLFVLSPGVFWLSAHVSCARLLALAGLFTVSPRLLIFMTGEPRTLLTPLEAFLAFQFGILSFGVSLGVLVNVRALSGVSYLPRLRVQRPLLAPCTQFRLQMTRVVANLLIRYSPLSLGRHS